MGLTDLFNQWIVERGSAVVQEKHIALFRDQLVVADQKVLVLQTKNEELQSKIDQLQQENEILREKIQEYDKVFHESLQNDVVQHELIVIGSFKWNVTVYSDKTFQIAETPYCMHHDMMMVEAWPLYFCPVNSGCPTIGRRDLPFAYQQATSILDAHLRKQK